jgi:histidine ammonia-lyase
MAVYTIGPDKISPEEVASIVASEQQIQLSEQAKQNIVRCRAYLDETIAASEAPIYGINTGFGSLCNVSIGNDDLSALQSNLIMSHACGMGDTVAPELVKTMLFLKVQALSYGYSGVQLETVQRLVDFYNYDVLPVVFEQGSLGASGDLAPLAHLCLPLIGMGEVWYKGKRMQTEEVYEQLGWNPIKPASKEGLALLNGTQFMAAYGVQLLARSKDLLDKAQVIAALSLEGFDGRVEPFHPALHAIRPHPGQMQVASNFCKLLDGSEIAKQEKKQVQDPYSFRCTPQVVGASLDVWAHCHAVFEREINSVTDNPNVFPDEDVILSGGNFHGQPLAMALDYLCLAMHEVGSISERRTYQLTLGKNGLPHFLAADAGLHSGMMIPQYTSAALVSQNKQLCTPASADTIDSSAGQEDHVSMGANAATKAWRVLNNLESILGIELLNAAQAIEFRRPLRSSSLLENVLAQFRAEIPFMKEDRILSNDMRKAALFVRDAKITTDG